jgi:hypothetical protein
MVLENTRAGASSSADGGRIHLSENIRAGASSSRARRRAWRGMEIPSSAPADGGSSSRAPRQQRILAAPRPTAAPPPVPRTGGGSTGPAIAATRSVPRKERMIRKKGKLVKALKVCTEISEDVKHLGSFLFVL